MLDFQSDLKKGLKSETDNYILILNNLKKFNNLKGLIESNNKTIEDIYGNKYNKHFKKWDIAYTDTINNREVTVELKTEDCSTGNLYLMYEKFNKPSGITTSESDLYIYIVKDINTMYIMSTKELQEKIEIWDKKEYRYNHKVLKNSRNTNKAFCPNISVLKRELKTFKILQLFSS